MEPEDALLYSQELSTAPYPQPVESNPLLEINNNASRPYYNFDIIIILMGYCPYGMKSSQDQVVSEVSLIRLETFAAFKFVLKPFRGKFHC
jgi:hypothetical protein